MFMTHGLSADAESAFTMYHLESASDRLHLAAFQESEFFSQLSRAVFS